MQKIEVLVKNEAKVEIFLEEVVVEKQEEKKVNESPNQDSSSKSTTRLQVSSLFAMLKLSFFC